jgi:hypothetical protein
VRNPQANPYQIPIISANTPYNVTEQSANIDITVSEDYGKGNSAILLEWGNDMVGGYTYSTTLTDKPEGTYTMTMDKLDTLPLSKTYYRVTVVNVEGKSSPLIGNFQVQKSLLTGVRQLNGTGSGDKTIVTAYATIPVEYIETNGDTTYSTTPTIGNSTADSRMLVARYNGNLTINSGVTLTPQVRKRGMFMYVDGALTVNGTISMTARGAANVPGDRILILTNSGTSYEIPAVGGSANGGVGTNGQTGGGGGFSSTGTNGAAGTSYSGGAGGGGGSGTNGSINGGPGGNGGGSCYYGGTTGGGAGNPGGTATDAYRTGGSGTGGLLIIYAKSIVVSSTGSIQSNGSTGGRCYLYCTCGSGSGGGSVNVFYQNTYTNSGSVVAGGGAGGLESNYGGGGDHGVSGRNAGAGTVRSVKVSN